MSISFGGGGTMLSLPPTPTEDIPWPSAPWSGSAKLTCLDLRWGLLLLPPETSGLVGLVAARAMGCATTTTPHVESAMQDGHYETYAMLDHPVGQLPAIDATLERVLREALQQQGYTEADTAQADLLVSYKVLTEDAHDVVAPLDGGNAAMGGGELGQGLMVDGSLGDHEKVVLVLLQERRTFRTVWIGWAVADVPIDELDSRSELAVRTIVRRLPSATH